MPGRGRGETAPGQESAKGRGRGAGTMPIRPIHEVMPDMQTPAAELPWRKRHPVISRTLLYGLGLGLAALLIVLFMDRQDDDERTRIAALQEELDGLNLVLLADPTGDAVLAKLDERFSGSDLPLITRGRALRWRAMAWRRKVGTATDGAARADATEQAEAALEACAALELPPAERSALALEWVEARLERRDVEGARRVWPEADDLPDVPSALLFTLLRAQALRLEEQTPAGVELVRSTLMGLEGPLDTEQKAYVGGRSWTAAEVAVQMANFMTLVGEAAEARPVWNRLRAAAGGDFDVQAAAARGLAESGARADALQAWRAAKAIHADLAAAEARSDPVLEALERESQQR